MQKFSLAGTTNHVFQINNQWIIQAQNITIDFYIISISEYQNYLYLAQFFYLIQFFLLNNIKKLKKIVIDKKH